ncbi:microviridin/marinostatin family tricyclic proteinase inhibitor [Flavobacterium sp. '19STA2R22 D10 B1']|uniref:microviridin/marinostatin family tricyclic proteinase inhibitor n=1 Tax=Flavobacterium aerium TaxID=3037261 RepID=UPI00278BF84E|nr:microviridin/marinostatin family tricyclic proteinase inhibitor [Flavobacterium sp. '19STA2R22 D10 B1']
MKNDKNLKKPFFANFLENQLSAEDKTEVQGGAGDMMVTLKYPSDGEDGPGTQITLKYPSDSDESGPITVPSRDVLHTMKYPSDSDESVLLSDI